MSELAGASLRERIEDRWQIPTLFVAVALLVGSIFQLKSTREAPTFESRLAQLSARVEDGFYTSAIEYGTRLTGREEITAAQRGEVHQHLARAHYLRAERERHTTAEQAHVVQEEYSTARRLGADLSTPDLVRLGNTYAWEQEYGAAISYYQQAVEASSGSALDIRRRIIELSTHELAYPPAQLLPLVEAFIEDAPDDSALLEWAAATRIELLASEGRNTEALAFLDELSSRFVSTRWADAHQYLVSLVLYRLGRQDEAEERLRALRNRLSAWDELYAKSGWLLGRVVLSDGTPQRPEEALSFFREVVNVAPATLYEAASRVGMGEALAALERFEESLEQYRRALEALSEFSDSAVFSPEVIRASATVVAENLRREGHLEAPLQYYELATSLIDKRDEELVSEYLQILGDLRAALGHSLRAKAEALPPEREDSVERRAHLLDEARYLFLEAGEAFQELARINSLNEARSAEATWRSADLFDEAGETRRSVVVLERFARERPDNELMPRVLLRLGQAWQTLGMLTEAVEAYRENLRRFPRTPDAGSGLIPLARCYVTLGGEENLRLAEKTLVDHILADSPIYTPEAEEFRDALFLLGELYSSEQRFEPSIAVLEEALERYPQDQRAVGAQSLLADAYRHSALALKEDIKNTAKASEWPRMRAQMKSRLERAAELFSALVRALETVGEQDLDALQRSALRQARLYQADCLFELGRYEEAVALYEAAAFIYRDEPAALSAYVQVISCRLSLGQLEEARAALRRAQYLLKIMPERVFEDDHVGQSREEWDRFLDWLGRAKLLGSEPLTGESLSRAGRRAGERKGRV